MAALPIAIMAIENDPQDPTVVNRPGGWVEFPGSLEIPTAGCYYLEADCAGGKLENDIRRGRLTLSPTVLLFSRQKLKFRLIRRLVVVLAVQIPS